MSPATTKQARELSTKKKTFLYVCYICWPGTSPYPSPLLTTLLVNHIPVPCLPQPAHHCRLSAFLTLHVAVGASVAVALSLLLLRL